MKKHLIGSLMIVAGLSACITTNAQVKAAGNNGPSINGVAVTTDDAFKMQKALIAQGMSADDAQKKVSELLGVDVVKPDWSNVKPNYQLVKSAGYINTENGWVVDPNYDAAAEEAVRKAAADARTAQNVKLIESIQAPQQQVSGGQASRVVANNGPSINGVAVTTDDAFKMQKALIAQGMSADDAQKKVSELLGVDVVKPDWSNFKPDYGSVKSAGYINTPSGWVVDPNYSPSNTVPTKTTTSTPNASGLNPAAVDVASSNYVSASQIANGSAFGCAIVLCLAKPDEPMCGATLQRYANLIKEGGSVPQCSK